MSVQYLHKNVVNAGYAMQNVQPAGDCGYTIERMWNGGKRGYLES